MDKEFIRDLDRVLKYLYEKQWLAEDKEANHSKCADRSELIEHVLTNEKGEKDGRPRIRAEHVLWRLSEDKYTEGHMPPPHNKFGDSHGWHLKLTPKGRLFIEGGGYQRQRFVSWSNQAWIIAKTIAAIAQAIIIIWLTWRATQSAADDQLQDDIIIELEKRNTTLMERNVTLENALLMIQENLAQQRAQNDSIQ